MSFEWKQMLLHVTRGIIYASGENISKLAQNPIVIIKPYGNHKRVFRVNKARHVKSIFSQ